MITSNDATTSNALITTVDTNMTIDKDTNAFQIAARKKRYGKRVRVSDDGSPILIRLPHNQPVSENGLRQNEMQTLHAKMTVIQAKLLDFQAHRLRVAPITNERTNERACNDREMQMDGAEQDTELQIDADSADTFFEAEFQAGMTKCQLQ